MRGILKEIFRQPITWGTLGLVVGFFVLVWITPSLPQSSSSKLNVPIEVDTSVKVVEIGQFHGNDSKCHYVYIVKDSTTGQEWIGITGVGLVERKGK